MIDTAVATEVQHVVHYGVLSLIPTLVTIVLALSTKRVVESLLLGILTGAWVIDMQTAGALHATLYALPNMFSTIAGHAKSATLEGFGIAKDPGRGELIVSIVLLGSFVTVLDKSGGAQAFAEKITKRIRTESGALLTAAVIGFSMFTSAYFGILVLGTMMRPIFDRFKISREKLAFYCDGTAAPTKVWLPFSGWIAFMVILIEQNIPEVGVGDGFNGFIRTMPYNFYCIGMILFILLLSMKWIPDFGPMRVAEQRVKRLGLLHAEGSKPMVDQASEEAARASACKGSVSDMFLPLITSVLVLFFLGMWDSKLAVWFPGLPKIKINSIQVMSLAFTAGMIVAGIKFAFNKLMTPTEYMDTVIEGGKSALIGAIIIVLAVTLGDIMKARAPEGLGTAPYLVAVLTPLIAAKLIPLITFLVCAGMAFATGTSWGTWSIMMPVVIPLALAAGVDPYVTAAAVLSGGAFGDHCGPISDTTVLSSIASNTDHIQHVRTQVPYALVVGGVSALGFLICGYML